jgi:hypothetical protein
VVSEVAQIRATGQCNPSLNSRISLLSAGFPVLSSFPRTQNAATERGLFVVKRLVELSSLRVTAEMAAARDGS